MPKSICKNCSKEYEYTVTSRKYKELYCSMKCKKEAEEKDNKPQTRICEQCGKEYFWTGEVKYYGKPGNFIDSKRFCCYECGKENKYTRVKATTIKNFGAIGWASKELNARCKQTSIERYGTSNNNQKTKETLKAKYGVENISQVKEVADKISKAWKSKSKEDIAERTSKTKQTKFECYGDENYVNHEKQINTVLEKYGVDNYSKTKECQEKTINTNLKKYGCERATQNVKVSKKISDTWRNKTKEELQEIENKRIKTNLEVYGVNYTSQNENVKKTLRENNIKKYGVPYTLLSEEVQAKIKENNLKKYGNPYCIAAKEVREKIINTTLERYGVPYNCLTQACLDANAHVVSKVNLKFQNKLTSYDISAESEFILENYSYDFKINDLLIEINPTYTHNSTTSAQIGKSKFKPKDMYYHYNKTKVARENGYKCIHIWDWDNEDKIIQGLLPRKTLYARNLQLKEVSLEDTTIFLNMYHLQNSCLGQEVRLGLYQEKELVEIMTFGKSRYNKKYEYELLRLCTKSGYKVVGGAEKLFAYFIKEYNPTSIISYCDNSKFSGEVYLRLGMQQKGSSNPSKHWFNLETGRHITDNLLRQRGYSQLHNDTEHKKGENNELLMLEAGYFEVYDCGQSTYVWNK